MMWLLAQEAAGTGAVMWKLIIAVSLFVSVGLLTYAWGPLVMNFIRRQEAEYDRVLRGQLLMDVSPRTVTVLGLGGMLLLGLIGYGISQNLLLAALLATAGAFLPRLTIKALRNRRLYQLEEQLVNGIRTLTSGVRAGLNLVQAMQLLARNGVRPISEEFGHLVNEYEHGVSLEVAMENAARRIGSPNYRLVFSALLTHRERGGDLGETLERIADSIREIHRLQKRVETLTAPGRTAARWMSAMPLVILGIFYVIAQDAVQMLFTDDLGKIFLLGIVVMNVLGYLWMRQIVNIDI
jgi:tight adherence protein B